MEARPVVTVWEPPHRAEFENNAGPITYHLTFTCKSRNGGTLLTTVIHAETHGTFKQVLDELVYQAVKRQHAGDLETLKGLLENEASNVLLAQWNEIYGY